MTQWFVLILSGLLLSFQVRAETLNIAAEDAWPPFSDEHGMGYSSELATAAFQLSGISLNIQTVPYVRALNMTQAGAVDACWNVTRQPSTEGVFIFGDEPLFQAAASYYYHKGNEHTFSRPADIPDGARVAVMNGYEYGAEFEQHRQRFNLIEVSKQKQMLSLLLNNRVDVAILFDHVFDYTVNRSQFDPRQLVRGHVNNISDIYIAFSRQKTESADRAKKLDQGLRALHANGEYQRILHQAPVLDVPVNK